jgi:hypothetical protein
MALHQLQSHDTVAAVQAVEPQGELTVDSDSVVAVSCRGGKKQQNKKRSCKQGKQCDNRPSQPIVEQSPMCWSHIQYSDKAYSCTKPCAWPEN